MRGGSAKPCDRASFDGNKAGGREFARAGGTPARNSLENLHCSSCSSSAGGKALWVTLDRLLRADARRLATASLTLSQPPGRGKPAFRADSPHRRPCALFASGKQSYTGKPSLLELRHFAERS